MAAVNNRFAVLGAFLLLFVISGCVSENERGPGIDIHTWSASTASLDAPWQGPRTLLYTYILSGDAAGGNPAIASSKERTDARDALAALLAESQANQEASTGHEANLLQHANQFVVPAKNYTGQKLTLDQYDFTQSVAILNRVRMALDPEMQARFDRPGPFLLAMRKPINEYSVAQTATAKPSVLVMLVDMSGKHPKAAPAYMRGFKAAVRKNLPDNFEQAPMLHAEFASVVLKLNEAIPFVATAYAETGKLIQASNGGPDGAGGKAH